MKKFVRSLNDEEARWLWDDWQVWARQDQLPPQDQKWAVWLILGGRGAGKTRAGAEWVRALASKAPYRIALIGETYLAARSVMVEGESGLLNIGEVSAQPTFYPSRRQLHWRSGAIAQLFSAEDPDALRGPQFHFAWCDELCKWRYAQQSWDMLQFALRLGKNPKQVITTTPRAMALLKQIMTSPQTITTRASSYANRAHLAASFFDQIIERYHGTRLGRQEISGELIEDDPDALWNRDMIEASRRAKPENLTRIVVAIDPPASHHHKSAECGIVIAGLGEDGDSYILGDYSQAGLSPNQWAQRALQACRHYHADRIVAEINQGGDMVEAVIRQKNPKASFKAVRASYGKRSRAEPIAALYEQNRVHHCASFERLEDQMCSWTGSCTQSSPDRLDAMVWALTDLMFGGAQPIARLRRI